LIGHAIIFASGLLWLSHFTGWSNVLAAGFIPFLPGAVAKTLIAFVAIPVLNRINN
jgi:biotin transporter BioY